MVNRNLPLHVLQDAGSKDGVVVPQIAIKDWGKKFTSDGLNSLKREPAKSYEDPPTEPFEFHEGQMQAWNSNAEVVTILAGRQSGKTVCGPYWLLREIQRRGPGDYALVGPTIELLRKRAIPALLTLFERKEQLGTYNKSERLFTFSPEGLIKVFGSSAEECFIFVGYATKPESLESATYKAVWADEAGQPDFKQSSWEALEGRRAIHDGRILLTTTPYAFNWLKMDLWDKWITGKANLGYEGAHAKYLDVIRFESNMNPTFSQAKFNHFKNRLPSWKFDLFYRAIFTRPAGAIFDCFTRGSHTVKRFPIPRHWFRYEGVDFGGTNCANWRAAMNPDTGDVVIYRCTLSGDKSVSEHIKDWEEPEDKFFKQPEGLFGKHARTKLQEPIRYGGSGSESNWRTEFNEHGHPIAKPPYSEVEPGIARVYALFKSNRMKIFDDLTFLIDEVESYARKVDDDGEPLPEIEDKHKYHRVDSQRYGCFGIPFDMEPPSIQPRATKQGPEFTPKEDRDEDDDQPQPKIQRRISRAR